MDTPPNPHDNPFPGISTCSNCHSLPSAIDSQFALRAYDETHIFFWRQHDDKIHRIGYAFPHALFAAQMFIRVVAAKQTQNIIHPAAGFRFPDIPRTFGGFYVVAHNLARLFQFFVECRHRLPLSVLLFIRADGKCNIITENPPV